ETEIGALPEATHQVIAQARAGDAEMAADEDDGGDEQLDDRSGHRKLWAGSNEQLVMSIEKDADARYARQATGCADRRDWESHCSMLIAHGSHIRIPRYRQAAV